MSKVVHFEIPALNPEKSAKFYADVFGWKIEPWGEPPYWIVTAGDKDEPGINGGIVQKATNKIVEESMHIENASQALNAVITINVDDIKTTVDQIKQYGGRVVMDIADIETIGQMAYFMDLDGNMIGILQPKM